ncbi:MAG: DeoR family transcriptional regulator, partial [Chloroflexota bacterium]
MTARQRLERIVSLVEEHGFLPVSELSELCQVSEMTIRRDLERLDKEKRIQRTYGGAVSLRSGAPAGKNNQEPARAKTENVPIDELDVLVATSVNPRYDNLLLERVSKKNIPVIAESQPLSREETVVAVDNYQAGYDLGRWAGEYARQKWAGRARVLDLTFHMPNTQARSKGFTAGIQSVLPETEIVLSLNAQSRLDNAYQLTRDALTAYPSINIIFAINDICAWGAFQAAKDLNIDPAGLIILPFGLEGDTLKNALMERTYCVVGLAMFPEIVGPACVEAAIAAYNHRPLPAQLITPYMILTPETLPEVYERQGDNWSLRREVVRTKVHIPLDIDQPRTHASEQMPRHIGLIVPFMEHEWYKNLTLCIHEYASRMNIGFVEVDAEQSAKDEVDFRRRQIARTAAGMINEGEVILIDGGPIANYLAECLSDRTGLTIITNSMEVFDILRKNPQNTLILTGGAFRYSSQMLVGPTAENALRELRADKLFLMVTGITLNFGLSHTNISEVTMKQAMIRSARQVILLADHTFFGHESVVQVASPKVVHQLVTDDALPASAR